MGLSCDASYQRWRENASWTGTTEDAYTGLWAELVRAYRLDRDQGQAFEFGVYQGLLTAYAVVTGDDKTSIERMVVEAASELVPS